MKIGNNVVIEGTATIENLPISNSSLSAIVQTEGNLYKRELGTISTASKESYIPGLSVAFPSIFNLNTESLDYNNRSLVVSLKNQLQGTVFMAPIAMNGTPAFRRIVRSDLTDANVVFTDDNTFVKKIGDTMSGPLIVNSADSEPIKLMRSSTVNSTIRFNVSDGVANFGFANKDTFAFGDDSNLNNASHRWAWVTREGQISSKRDGDSSQWKQAYDRGDFRDYGLGTTTTSPGPSDINDIPASGMYRFNQRSSSGENIPYDYGSLLQINRSSNEKVQIALPVQSHLTDRHISYRGKLTAGWGEWVKVWDEKNLTKVSQLVNDSGYVTTDTTYTAGNELIINAGTSTVNQLWNATVLNNWGIGKFFNNRNIKSRQVGSSYGADADTLFVDGNGGFVTSYGTAAWLANGAFSGYGGIMDWAHNNDHSLQLQYDIGHGTTAGGRLAFRTKHSTGFTIWKEFYHTGNLVDPATQTWVNTQGFKQSLELGVSVGSVSISSGNNIRLNSLAVRDLQDANVRLKESSLVPYRTLAGNSNYPAITVGGGIRWERVSTELSQTGFYIHKINGQDLLWYKTFDGENTENSWKMIADRDWVTSKGYVTTDTTYSVFTRTVPGLVPMPGGTTSTRFLREDGTWVVPTNTTYSAGTLALLNTGTDTSNRVWPTKVLADYVVAKLAQGADSIWEHTPQGGLRIRNYDSLATRDGAIAITKGGGATKINAIGIGTSVNSDGNDGIVVGPLSVNLGTYGTVVGPYSVNTAMEGVVTGPFLQNNQRGCTVTGRYNHPIQNATTNTITDSSPLFIIGNGKSASIRSNAYEMFSDGKGEFANVQSYKNQHSFGDMDIPNWKFIQDNIGGGDGNGSEDWVSNYGSQISVFEEQKANEQLGSSPYGGTGEILADQKFSNVDKPTLVYLGNDGIWRKWNNSANAEQENLSNSAVLGIALSDMKSVLLRGYYLGKMSVELQNLVGDVENGNMFHSINKGTLMAGSSTNFTERVFGYSINKEVAYFNPWMFKR